MESDSLLRWRKADLHTHCSADPRDFHLCTYSALELIEDAARKGLEILAITCHDLDVWSPALSAHAAGLGITLVPGMEATVEGRRHVLAYNFRTGSGNLNTLERIGERRRPDTLVIAPHPYFPSPTCVRGLLGLHADVFDAVEVSGFHTRHLDFNSRARRFARMCGKPLVGNSDAHKLWQVGRTCTWVFSEPDVPAIIQAVREGKVRVESEPLRASEVAAWWAEALWRSFAAACAPRQGERVTSDG